MRCVRVCEDSTWPFGIDAGICRIFVFVEYVSIQVQASVLYTDCVPVIIYGLVFRIQDLGVRCCLVSE